MEGIQYSFRDVGEGFPCPHIDALPQRLPPCQEGRVLSGVVGAGCGGIAAVVSCQKDRILWSKQRQKFPKPSVKSS